MARDNCPAGNLVGPQIRQLRSKSGLSQPALAAACQRLGWDVGRDIIARIESQVRHVTDAELLYLANALASPLEALFPGGAGISKPKG
jgi:transcriptional regulator with XRE-family HTH domain